MINKQKIFVILFAAVLIFGCKASNTDSGKSTETGENQLKEPKSSIAYQLDLLKAGNFEKFKECFTSRIRDRVKKEDFEKAKSNAANMTLDELFASAEMGEYEGKKTAKIKMKNGRTLTTLVETDGKWLADTIWYQ